MLVRWTSTVLWVTKSACAISARAASEVAPQIVASSSAWRSCSRASERRLALRSAAPSSVRAFACSSFAGLVSEHLYGFLEQSEPVLAALDQACCAQRRPERPGGTPGARQLELFTCQSASCSP